MNGTETALFLIALIAVVVWNVCFLWAFLRLSNSQTLTWSEARHDIPGLRWLTNVWRTFRLIVAGPISVEHDRTFNRIALGARVALVAFLLIVGVGIVASLTGQ